jgi:nucleotide-binding universal stress UspA family protein
VEFALRDAARRGVRVDAVTAYEPPEHWAWAYVDLTHTGDPVTDHHIALQGAKDLIADVRAGLQPDLGAQLPEVTVHVRRGRPSEVLTEVSQRAAVLVVGHRGRGALASAVLGSVGLHCVLHANCLVTVVPPPDS